MTKSRSLSTHFAVLSAAMEGFVSIPNCNVEFKGAVSRSVATPMTGHIALLLIDKEGDVFLKASTTRPDIALAHDEVLLKDLSLIHI